MQLPRYTPPASFLALAVSPPHSLPSMKFSEQEIALLENYARYTPLFLQALQKVLKTMRYEDFLEQLKDAEIWSQNIQEPWNECATWLYFYGYHNDAESLRHLHPTSHSLKSIHGPDAYISGDIGNIAHYFFLIDNRPLDTKKSLPKNVFQDLHYAFPHVRTQESSSPIINVLLKTRNNNQNPTDFLYACYIDSLCPSGLFNKTSTNPTIQPYNHSLYLLTLNLYIQAESDILGYTQAIPYQKGRLIDFLDNHSSLPVLKKVHDTWYNIETLNTLHTKLERLMDSEIPYDEWGDIMSLPYDWIARIVSDR